MKEETFDEWKARQRAKSVRRAKSLAATCKYWAIQLDWSKKHCRKAIPYCDRKGQEAISKFLSYCERHKVTPEG